MSVAVIGASGFVGRALIKNLLDQTDQQVIAISRTPHSINHSKGAIHYRAVPCDLHNLLQLESPAQLSFFLPSASVSSG